MKPGYAFTDKLIEPLSPATRKARKSLLGVGLIGIAIAKIKLVPSKIAVLGIEFTEANQEALILVLILIIAYYTVATVVYLASEMVAWQIIVRSSESMPALDHAPNYDRVDVDDEVYKRQRKRANITYALGKPTFIVRLAVESLLPIAVAVYALVVLFALDVEELSASELGNQKGAPCTAMVIAGPRPLRG